MHKRILLPNLSLAVLLETFLGWAKSNKRPLTRLLFFDHLKVLQKTCMRAGIQGKIIKDLTGCMLGLCG